MHQLQLQLRPTEPTDLAILFQFQLNEEANHLAAFTSKHTADQAAYIEKYTGHLNDPAINMQTILADDRIVGSIASFVIAGDREITYWIDRDQWGKGIGATALASFLAIETTRPLFGRTAFDNIGSQKVLEKNGFVKTGTDKGFANARQAVIEEFIYQLT